MKIIVNNSLNKIYNNYITGNYKEISIRENNNKIHIKVKEKNKVTNNITNNEVISRMSIHNFVNVLVEDFILNNNIVYYQKKLNNSVTLENDRNQTIMIYSHNLKKKFSLIVDEIDKINIINKNIYDLVDNNLIDRLEIHYNNLINSKDKSITYYKESKILKLIINEELDNTEEIINLINYYKNSYGDYHEVTVIDINNGRKKKIITLNNKEIDIYGKDLINYIERGKIYGKVNNGKTSKSM